MKYRQIKFVDEHEIENKTVLLRVDFNVSTNVGKSIVDDARIKKSLPTIKYLLKNNNKLIIVSHLSRPKKRESQYSLKIIIDSLKGFLPDYSFTLIDDFLSDKGKGRIAKQKEEEILILENIRFYRGEQINDPKFARYLSEIADVYVNDAFAVSHRNEASVVNVPTLIPSFGGLLLKTEMVNISNVLKKRERPFVVVVGGAKIETKVNLISKFIPLADYILIGGGVANTFLCAYGHEIGQSFCDYEKVKYARQLLHLAKKNKAKIILPTDVVLGSLTNGDRSVTVAKIGEIPQNSNILDIGPSTQKKFGSVLSKAKTIVWNGPLGYTERAQLRKGTDFIYNAIIRNRRATSLIGGGDTIAALAKKDNLNKITHVSTGGSAMLEYIEKDMLPGINALLHEEVTKE